VPTKRDLHPAARDAVARYSEVWDENDRLTGEAVQLRGENEVLRRVDAEKTALISDLRRTLEESQRVTDQRVAKLEQDCRHRVAESERAKERYLRFAVAISERLKVCGDQIAAAHDSAMEMAKSGGVDMETEIAKLLESSKQDVSQDAPVHSPRDPS
jgi:ribosomal protein L16 Arg81 hydroxylase